MTDGKQGPGELEMAGYFSRLRAVERIPAGRQPPD
jgi:hypothetical protein